MSSRTRRQEKNWRRMDTSSRTNSVERPVRAVDLFIASLDALTLLEGSSTLSARIDSDERATLLASLGSNRRAGMGEERLVDRVHGKKRTGRSRGGPRPGRAMPKAALDRRRRKEGDRRAEEERSLGPPANSSNISHRPNEALEDRRKTRRKWGTSASGPSGRYIDRDIDSPSTVIASLRLTS